MNFSYNSQQSPEDLYGQAAASFNSGQHIDAMLLLEEAIKKNPEHPFKFYEKLGRVCGEYAHTLLGEEYQKTREIYLKRAGEAYEKAFTCDPDNFDSAYLAAASYYGAGFFDRAEILAEKAFALNKTHADVAALRAMCALQQEKYEGKEEVFQTAMDIADESPLLDIEGRALTRYGLAMAIEAKAEGSEIGRRGDYHTMSDLLQESMKLGRYTAFFVLETAEFYLRNVKHGDIYATRDPLHALGRAKFYAEKFVEKHPRDHACANLEQAEDILKRCDEAYEAYKIRSEKGMNNMAQLLGFESAEAMIEAAEQRKAEREKGASPQLPQP